MTATTSRACITNDGNTIRDISNLILAQGSTQIGKTPSTKCRIRPGKTYCVAISGSPGEIRLTGVGGLGIYATSIVA